MDINLIVGNFSRQLLSPFFKQQAESFFPNCPSGVNTKFYYNIASSHHAVGNQGLQGDPIVVGGSDADGDTTWQLNEGSDFDLTVALRAM